MAYDAGLVEILSEDLGDRHDVTTKGMFGGMCFLLGGNMLCGISKDGGMFRVGKSNEGAALQLPGISPLSFTGRKMGGLVEASADAMADDSIRRAALALALDFVAPLPPK